MTDSTDRERVRSDSLGGDHDSLTRLPLPNSDRPVLPVPEVVLLLDPEGRILRRSGQHAGERLRRLDFSPGQGVHEALHPGCRSNGDCELAAKWQEAWEAHGHGLPLEWLTVLGVDRLTLSLKLRLQKVGYACGVLFQDAGQRYRDCSVLFVQDLTGPTLRTVPGTDSEASRARRAAVYELRRSTDPDPDVVASLDERLRMLTGRLLSATASERDRIAAELHDSLGQTLAVLRFEIEGCVERSREGAGASDPEVVERVFAHSKRAQKELREIIGDLRRTAISDDGLISALEGLCGEFRLAQPAIVLAVDLPERPSGVPYHLAVAIYRIAQEALHNVADHSGADQASLVLTTGGGVRLVVSDNGKGMPVGRSRRRGLGLVTMRERAAASKGEYALSSEPGKGCAISVSWTAEGVDLLR